MLRGREAEKWITYLGIENKEFIAMRSRLEVPQNFSDVILAIS